MSIRDRDYMKRPFDEGDGLPRKDEPELRPEHKLDLFLRKHWKLFAVLGLCILAVPVLAVVFSWAK